MARACGGEDELFQAVAELLRASAEAGYFLETPILTVPAELQSADPAEALDAEGTDPPADPTDATDPSQAAPDPFGLTGAAQQRGVYRTGL